MLKAACDAPTPAHRHADSGVEPCSPDVDRLTTSNHRHRHSPTAPTYPDGAEVVAHRVVHPEAQPSAASIRVAESAHRHAVCDLVRRDGSVG